LIYRPLASSTQKTPTTVLVITTQFYSQRGCPILRDGVQQTNTKVTPR
jgi:hypothetical protein